MKRICAWAVTLSLCVTTAMATAPTLTSAQSATVLDSTTGQTIWQSQADSIQSAGVSAQMMTALLVLEQSTDLSATVTITDDMLDVPDKATVLGMSAGDVYTVSDLLSAVLLEGAADAAQALAVQVAGDLPSFVEQMNTRAQELGGSTTFVSAHGYDESTTTATTLANIGNALVQLDDFLTLATQPMVTLPATDSSAELTIYTENTQIRTTSDDYDPTVIAVMGGQTEASGQVQLTVFDQSDRALVTVTMGNTTASDAVADSVALSDYVYENTTNYIISAQTMQSIADTASIDAPEGGFPAWCFTVDNDLLDLPISMHDDGDYLTLQIEDQVVSVLPYTTSVLGGTVYTEIVDTVAVTITDESADTDQTDASDSAQDAQTSTVTTVTTSNRWLGLVLIGLGLCLLGGGGFYILRFQKEKKQQQSQDRQVRQQTRQVAHDLQRQHRDAQRDQLRQAVIESLGYDPLAQPETSEESEEIPPTEAPELQPTRQPPLEPVAVDEPAPPVPAPEKPTELSAVMQRLERSKQMCPPAEGESVQEWANRLQRMVTQDDDVTAENESAIAPVTLMSSESTEPEQSV